MATNIKIIAIPHQGKPQAWVIDAGAWLAWKRGRKPRFPETADMVARLGDLHSAVAYRLRGQYTGHHQESVRHM